MQDPIVEPEFMEALAYYYWRGNVRELSNVIEKVVFMNEGTKLNINSLPQKLLMYTGIKA